MSPPMIADTNIDFRHPDIADGIVIRDFIESCGNLDTNSAYFYLLHCRNFRQTCLIAECQDEMAGVVLGHCIPGCSDTIFVWQIGVKTNYRRQGIGRSMVMELVDSLPGIRYVEAHVGPSNLASQSMFRRFAEFHEAPWETTLDFTREHFRTVDHDEEHRIRIGPLTKRSIF